MMDFVYKHYSIVEDTIKECEELMKKGPARGMTSEELYHVLKYYGALVPLNNALKWACQVDAEFSLGALRKKYILQEQRFFSISDLDIAVREKYKIPYGIDVRDWCDHSGLDYSDELLDALSEMRRGE